MCWLVTWKKKIVQNGHRESLELSYPKLNDRHLKGDVSLYLMHSFLHSNSDVVEITFLIADERSLAADPYPR